MAHQGLSSSSITRKFPYLTPPPPAHCRCLRAPLHASFNLLHFKLFALNSPLEFILQVPLRGYHPQFLLTLRFAEGPLVVEIFITITLYFRFVLA